jgi:hypothetical protein
MKSSAPGVIVNWRAQLFRHWRRVFTKADSAPAQTTTIATLREKISMQLLKTSQDVDNYLNEWKDNINGYIALKDASRSLEDYPEVKEAFEKMTVAWKASFEDKEKIEKINKRDKAILEVEISIGKYLK